MALVDVGEFVPGEGLDRTRLPLERARHAPGYVYGTPQSLTLEKERLFMRDWLYVGRAEEFAQAGDYRTFRILDEPVVITRDADGELNAFLNVCAHRGVEVAAGNGNARDFSCPYHGWLYDLKGRLVGAPYMKEVGGFDQKSCRLKLLRLDVWAGNLFICFDPDAAPFAEFAADYIAEMSFLGMDKCRLAGKIVKELDCNWKLCVENIMDLYHVGTLHADTFGSHTNADPADVKLLPRGGMCFTYTSAPATPDGISRFGKLPWFDDKPDSFAFMGFMQPNTHIIARSDHVRALITLPIAHDRCRITIYSLFPEVHHARPDFAAKADEYHTFMASVLDEDIDMVRSLQRAMASRNFTPGPMVELEKPIHHVLNGLLEQLYGSGPTPAG